MRRKEFAVSLGLATPGKGRMSREALAAIEKAITEGKVFDDMPGAAPVKPVKAPTSVEKRPVVPKAQTHKRETSDSVMGDVSLRYPWGTMFKGVDSAGKTHKVNGAQACGCGYSLIGHICNNPTALIGSPLERISVSPI